LAGELGEEGNMAEERRIAVVTGGNRGMGFETCRQLGRRGYRVVLACRDPQAGCEAAGGLRAEGLEVEPFRLDLTRAEDIANLVMHARRWLGRVDALVNNAGLYLEIAGSSVRDRTSVFNAQMPVVRAIVETNLFGPLALSQGLVALMRERGYGRVVNVASAMGQLAEMGGGAPGYRLAGVGINAMTRIFAQELQGTNVLVNSVDPGWVRTRSPEALRSIEEGVETTVWLATLPDGGPSGQFFRDKQPIPW
jgi:NAD(P)-dependent dehydrogenase (short-subunit alcohol dehydrogenase family)